MLASVGRSELFHQNTKLDSHCCSEYESNSTQARLQYRRSPYSRMSLRHNFVLLGESMTQLRWEQIKTQPKVSKKGRIKVLSFTDSSCPRCVYHNPACDSHQDVCALLGGDGKYLLPLPRLIRTYLPTVSRTRHCRVTSSTAEIPTFDTRAIERSTTIGATCPQ